ncbi:mu-like prophage FluMu gp41 family protein [Ochrobactrum quorumnocens]|uniref:Mu-like prophage FluMu gp41 family protein n=1 Tax=Ochrobactrum quorumnocens TaxID=271865 RepID=A0A248UGF1_9HYPH|nr:phage tail assembly protein [[Ochrobactrum] quorumnocens]ASV85491.1 mu-like prophage FluMu gp41 family protein [[Ochrobactrum] quorumnocens]
MSNETTLQLSKPYTLAGKETDKLSFREPVLGDLVRVETAAKGTGDNGYTAVMIAQLSGATVPEVHALSLTDYRKCAEAMRPFLNTESSDGDA